MYTVLSRTLNQFQKSSKISLKTWKLATTPSNIRFIDVLSLIPSPLLFWP